ncbi:MAG: PHP domain-containing protein [Candidatus Muiribacteriota bacterium]
MHLKQLAYYMMQASDKKELLKADLHIHSVLSNCSSLDMGPKKIVQKLKQHNIKVVSITDHNSCLNCRAFVKVAEKEEITVIPGIEVTTAEEIHVLSLFKNIEDAEELSSKIYKRLLDIEINEQKQGYQIVLDDKENILRMEKKFLNQASLSIEELINFTEKRNGIIIFSHIDKAYNSLIANLGFIPDSYKDKIFEITKNEHYDLNTITNSDAHTIEDIGRRYFFIKARNNIEKIFKALKKGCFSGGDNYYDA